MYLYQHNTLGYMQVIPFFSMECHCWPSWWPRDAIAIWILWPWWDLSWVHFIFEAFTLTSRCFSFYHAVTLTLRSYFSSQQQILKAIPSHSVDHRNHGFE